MSGTQPCPIDEEIGRILNNYLDQAARGIRCSEHELLARYPQHAPVLNEHLAVLKGMPDTLPVCPVDESRLDPTAALADPPDALHPELHIPGYRVLGRIGQGGMGVVYLGEEYATGLFIAIKCPQGSFLDNVVARQCFAREAEAWTKLTHPNIVRAFDIRDDKTTDYRPAIFMQYCDRGSMADRLKDRGPSLSPDNLDILIQVCWGMEFAHAQGFVHCDLKPSNVLLNSEGSALVTDFGLVRSLAAPSEASPRRFQDTLGLGQQALSRVAGTPPYMPPEQWRPGVELGTRVDVYAFGIMLYEAVCGTLPFKPARLSEWRMCHEHTEPPNPREFNCCIPGSLAALMVSCLAKRPEERPAGFAAVAESLAIAYRELTHEEHASRRSKPTRIEVSKAEKEAHAWALLRLAGGCRLRGDLTEADRQYHEALSVFEQTGHKRGMGTCYTNLGVLASRRCEYEDAVELFNLDLGICSELDDRQGIAKCLGNMGIVAASSGQYEKAMGLYRRSLGIKEQIKDLAGMGACYTNMGNLASKRRKYEQPRELLRKS